MRRSLIGWAATPSSGLVDEQRRVLQQYGVAFDVWSSEQRDVRDAGLPERAIEALSKRGLTYEHDGALWFRSTVVRGRQGPRAAPLERRADLLRRRHRLSPLS